MNKIVPILTFFLLIVIVTVLLLLGREEAKAPELTEALQETPEFLTAEDEASHPQILSLLAYANKKYDGRDLKLERVLEKNTVYTRHYITYKSGELVISGIMNIPNGTAPAGGWPLLILNHGHIDTNIYTNGRGLRREQDYFARNGFAVLHPDYRDHAESSKSPDDRLKTRVGYAEDVINAVYAVKASDLPVSKEAIGMLGHSMGGGITQSVAIVQPNLIKAAVLYAPVSMNYQDSYERWMSREPASVAEVQETYGTPEANPDFWAGLNGENFVDRIQIPLRYYHGTNDADVPYAWSQETVELLKKAGKSAELTTYQGEGHEFGPKWNDFMATSAAFFRANGVK